MNPSYIKFAAQTPGEQALRLLRSKGIAATLQKNPHPNQKEGCSYALFVRGNTQNALALIERAGIRHRGIETLREER